MTLPRDGWVQPVEGVPGGIPIPVDVDTPNRATFATNQKNVASHLVGVQLPAQAVPDGFSVSIIAKKTNTRNIYLGNSKAHAEDQTSADILAPGDVRTMRITNWNLMWISSDVDAEGVTIISET